MTRARIPNEAVTSIKRLLYVTDNGMIASYLGVPTPWVSQVRADQPVRVRGNYSQGLSTGYVGDPDSIGGRAVHEAEAARIGSQALLRRLAVYYERHDQSPGRVYHTICQANLTLNERVAA